MQEETLTINLPEELVLYAILDGTLTTNREQAVEANQELLRDYTNGHY